MRRVSDVCFVLFGSTTEAMAMEEAFREDGIKARIAPTPHDLQGLAGCGVALMLDASVREQAEECIRRRALRYAKIVGRASDINPRRDRFC